MLESGSITIGRWKKGDELTANSIGPVMSLRCAFVSVLSGEGVWPVRSPYLVGLSSGNMVGRVNIILGTLGVINESGVPGLFS